MSAEPLAVIAAIVRRHTERGRTVPLVQRYDNHERRMSDPMPFLFQRHTGAVPRVISPATVLVMLRRRRAELAEQHPGFRTACFTPHDFRRLLATDLVNNGLPLADMSLRSTRMSSATTRNFSTRAGRRGQRTSMSRSPTASGPNLRSTSTGEGSSWADARDRTALVVSISMRVCGAQCSPSTRRCRLGSTRSRPVCWRAVPVPSTRHGWVKLRDRPHPHLTEAEASRDQAAGPCRAGRARHAASVGAS
jgi:hypothetical protein